MITDSMIPDSMIADSTISRFNDRRFNHRRFTYRRFKKKKGPTPVGRPFCCADSLFVYQFTRQTNCAVRAPLPVPVMRKTLALLLGVRFWLKFSAVRALKTSTLKSNVAL